MISYDLTEEEIDLIENLREKKKVNKTQLKRDINKFLNGVEKLQDVVNKLYDLCETNYEAERAIKSEIDYSLLIDLYETFEANL